MLARFDVSACGDISFTHHQPADDEAVVQVDLWQGHTALGRLTLSREQALNLRETINDWASFYGAQSRGEGGGKE